MYCRVACIGFIIVADVFSSQAAQSPPSISHIPDQRTFAHVPSRTVSFLIGDAQTAAADLVVTGQSSNSNLVPATNIVFGGSSSNRTVTVTPREYLQGTATITVTVRDAMNDTASDSFVLTVAGLTEIAVPLLGMRAGSVAWGDYDNDGDLDILQTGIDSNGVPATIIYQNNGGAFSNIQAGLMGVYGGEAKWGDYDNDGDLDILLSGYTTNDHLVRLIYRNDGNNVFTPLPPLLDILDSGHGRKDLSVAWGDYDNDGDLDALFTGYFTTIYRNDGTAGFTNSGLAFPSFSFSAAAWGDADNDGNLDFVVMGTENLTNFMRVYRNEGPTGFSVVNAGLPPVTQGGLAWGDYDGDGNLDLVFTGGDTNSLPTSGVLHNNGGITFSNSFGPTIASEKFGSVAWGDYDNDGKLDFAIVNGNFTMVYRNLGGGSFSGDGLPGGIESYIAWGDYDNDGDLDLLQMSWSADGYSTKIFRNDGAMPDVLPTSPTNLNVTIVGRSAVFNWSPSTDADQTAALSYNLSLGTTPGAANIVGPMANLSTGQRRLPASGNAGFRQSLTITNLAPGTYYWSVQAIDNTFAGSPFAAEKAFRISTPPTISAIGDQSIHVNSSTAKIPFTIGDDETAASNLVLTASSSNTNLVNAQTGIVIAGSGTNRTVAVTPLAEQVGGTVITVSVTDEDGLSTNASFFIYVFNTPPMIYGLSNVVLFPNSATVPLPFTITDAETPGYNLALNASSSNTNLVPVQNILFGGPGNDRLLTIKLASNQVGNATITITVTDPQGGTASDSLAVEVLEFRETQSGLPGLDYSSVALGDYDNDGRLDILIAGYASYFSLTRIYHNDGNGNFTDINAGLPGVRDAAVAWGDFDNDGWLDFAVTGGTDGPPAGVITRIYRNNRDGTFTDIQAGLPPVSSGAAVWADFDNDGLLDLLISGSSPTGSVSAVYRNNGNGTFADLNAGLPGLSQSAAACADFDRDGKVDILLSGVLGSSEVTRIYRNLGNGVFVDINAGLLPVSGGSVAWGDFDNDGWPDVLLTGSVPGGGESDVYRNNGDGTFTRLAAYLPRIYSGFSAWGDYDNDGKLDILLSGATYSGFQSAIYRGNADGTFNGINDSFGLIGAYGAAGAWGDLDGDGHLDVLLSSIYETLFFKNVIPATNTAPAAPTGLSVALSESTVTFNWVPAAENQSPSNSLTYNLRVGTTPGGEDVVSPSASQTGLRRVVSFGARATNTWTLEDPPVSGTYYWSVQTIDGSFAGSPFAVERSFTAEFLPGAHTLKATRVGNTLATFNGLASAKGLNAAMWFEWGTTTNFGNVVGFTPLASNAVRLAVSTTVTNLIPETNNYFRLVVSNTLGQIYGATMGFYSGIPPTITPLSPFNITSTQAVLQAQLIPNRSPAYTWIEYGETTNYGLGTIPVYAGTGTNAFTFSQTVRGLTAFTVYHYHVVATNEYGVRRSPDSTFTTKGYPTVATLNAITTNLTSATLAATVNPNGMETTFYFEYGTSTNYGSLTAFNDLGSARGNLTVTQEVSGLQPGTVYNFHVVAVNNDGTSIGGNRAVRTLSPFTNTMLSLPPMLLNGAVAWGDYNNDGRLDLVMAGQTNASTNFGPITRIYRNDGTNFTELDVGIPGVRNGAVAWGDFNNDGLLDLIVCGATNSVPTTAGLICRVYRNEGNDTFIDIGAGLPGVFNSAVAWADFNNDGRLDLIFSGSTNSNTSFPAISRVYLNNGKGGFTNGNVALPRLQFASIACADYNNDGFMDILLAGATNSSSSTLPISAVFRNNGNGTFSNANVGLIGVHDAAVAWGDFDDDGDVDILLTGNTNVNASSTTTTPVTRVYRNNGNGTFSDINAGLAGVYRGVAAWGDFDSDGKLDVLIAGEGTNSQTYLNTIYRNTGNGEFQSLSSGMPGTTFSAGAAGDYNNDGRLDVFTAGQMLAAPGGTAPLYRNLFPATNSPPAAPTAPQTIVSANAATFRWDPASDNASAASGLTYNLRVGTSPGREQIFSPAAAADGTRRIAAMGNVGQRKIWTLNLPPAGTFYWAVQAIDHSFAGSPFTAEQVFVISGPPTITLGSVTNLSTNSVTLNGFVDANGFGTMAYFEWGTTTNYGNSTVFTNFATNAAYAPVSATLTGLTSVTVYYWRLVATNSSGVATSADQAFLLPEAPLIVSQSVTNITGTKGTLTALINPEAASTLAFFQWGLTPVRSNTTAATNIGSGTNTVLVSAQLTNLPAGTICYYRAIASSGVGSAFGLKAFFQTAPAPRFADLTTQPNGTFQMQFIGASNLDYEVQASTDLSNWMVLGNAASLTNGLYLYLDLDATNYPFRYYRVRSP
jgi:hypothetical protein